MARSPKSKPRKEPRAADELLAAMKFIQLAQHEKGPIYQTHTIVHNEWALGFDGVVSAAHPIRLDISAAPHTGRFIDALERCGEQLTVTSLDAERLGVLSGKFKAAIPCAHHSEMTFIQPDSPIAPLLPSVMEGLKLVGALASDSAQTVVTASALLRANTVVATDRNLILEFWHGCDMPPDLVVPKQFINAVAKVGLAPVSFGFTPGQSVTFHFENGAWLKTQMYSEPWPNIARIFDAPYNGAEPPAGFWEGIEAVRSFTEDDDVRLWADQITSHDTHGIGAAYECPGIGSEWSFNIRRALIAKPYVQTIDLNPADGILRFQGDKIRGALSMKRR